MVMTAANSAGDPKYQASALVMAVPERCHVVATPYKNPGRKQCASHADDAEDDRDDPN